MSPELVLDVDDAVPEAWLEEKFAAEAATAAEGKSPAVGRRFDVDEAVLDAWQAEKLAAGVPLAAGDYAEEKLGAEVVVAAEGKSPAYLEFPTDSTVADGGGLPPYDPYVNYLSPRPRFLFYDPKRAEQLWRELEFDESSSSQSGDSISEQSTDDDDDDCLQPIQEEGKGVEKGGGRHQLINLW